MFRIALNTPAAAAASSPSVTRPQTCSGPVAGPVATTTCDEVLLGNFGPEPLEAGFRAWVQGQAKADVLIVRRHDAGRDPVAIPLEAALRVVSTSTRPLAPARGESLGLPADVTLGEAATALLDACADPDGPRCRSYRSGTYFLRGLALLAVDEHLEDGPTEGSDRTSDRSWGHEGLEV